MGDRQEIHPNQRALALTLFGTLLSTIICTWQLFRIPSDSKNAFLFGLSKERLLMLACFVILFLGNLFWLAYRIKLYESILSKPAFSGTVTAAAVLTLFFLLMPDYRFGRSAAYFVRLRPFILWIFLTSLCFSLFNRYDRNRFAGTRETFRNISESRKFILPVLAVLIAGVAFVEISGLGKKVESSLWNKNGVPLQSIQLFVLMVVFVLLHKLGIYARIGSSKKLLNFLLIWICAALIWSQAPLMDHFFAPGPYEPNLEYYPYSDAITYDLAAQTALNGWGFNLGRTLLKPTLVMISYICHALTGNSFNNSMLLQSALFGILPAIIYLFGSAIGGTVCGYLAAALSIIKEWNALNTQKILTIHSRLMMSEFLAQILLAAFAYAIFRWLKHEGRESLYAAIAGGTLTLGIFTRYNFAAFLPAALLILLIGFWKNFRALIKPLLIFILTIALTAAPILYRDSKMPGGAFAELNRTINKVLIAQRFNTVESSTEADQPTAVPINAVDSVENSLSESSEDKNLQSASEIEKTEVFSETDREDFNTGQITQEFQNNNSIINLPVIASMINHGLHNFIASALTLPMEPTFQDLHHLYKNEGDGLWRDDWAGQLTFRQWLFAGFWILVGAVTIGNLLKLHGIAGFSILYFWLVYAFSIGFSRSSGGRYVVPCNWIPMLLLAFCCTLFLEHGKIALPTVEAKAFPAWKTAGVMACFTAYFVCLILIENMVPSKKTAASEGDLTILRERLAEQAEIDWELVEDQYKDDILHITHGVAVYPRFYYFRVGEHTYYGSLGWKNYSRLAFYGINREAGSRIYQEYLMPHTGMVSDFPNNSVFRAISCKSENGYEDVLAVTIDTPDGQTFTYVRDPLPEFSCPVPEPVCITNENCY